MSLLSKAIDLLRPTKWAGKSESRKFAYDMADLVARLRAAAPPSDISPQWEVRQNRVNALMSGRDLDRNNAWVHGLFDALTNNIIGSGISPEPRIKKKRARQGKGAAAKDASFDKLAQDELEDSWKMWNEQGVDINQKMSFHDVQYQVERDLWPAGEVLVILSVVPPTDKRRIPLVLEVCETERLANIDHNPRPGGNEVIQGIEFDAVGRRAAYHIYERHPGDTLKQDPIRVPADRVLHIFTPSRIAAVRGISRLHASANALLGLSQAFNHEITRMGVASMYAFLWKSAAQGAPPFPKKDGEAAKLDPHGNLVGNLMGGGILKTGGLNDSLEVGGPTFSVAFEPVAKLLLGMTAVGLNTSRSFLMRDFSDGNFSSQRMGHLEDRKHWRPRQRQQIAQLGRPVYKEVIRVGQLVGEVASKHEPEEIKASWRTDGWDWVDPEKDIAADKEAVKAGFKSPQQVCGEHGGDFYDIVDQLAEAQEYADEKEVKLDIFGEDPMEMLEAETESQKDVQAAPKFVPPQKARPATARRIWNGNGHQTQ